MNHPKIQQAQLRFECLLSSFSEATFLGEIVRRLHLCSPFLEPLIFGSVPRTRIRTTTRPKHENADMCLSLDFLFEYVLGLGHHSISSVALAGRSRSPSYGFCDSCAILCRELCWHPYPPPCPSLSLFGKPSSHC